MRNTLLPKAKNNFSLPRSMLDPSWMGELAAKHGSAGYIFILEGVSMYFKKEEFKEFFIALPQKFRGYVLSDFMSNFAVKKFDHSGCPPAAPLAHVRLSALELTSAGSVQAGLWAASGEESERRAHRVDHLQFKMNET